MKKKTKGLGSIRKYLKALRDKNTPKSAKILAIISIIYIIAPADFVTDAIPFLGWLDDAAILAILNIISSRMIPEKIKEEQ
ncbi:MAG: DUF1232 domain-containing protein [Tissierellia bacterium]|nr:DUF1232 domain-containing protein [Tissierellia bacterium]